MNEQQRRGGGICRTSKMNMQAFLCVINSYVLVDLCAWGNSCQDERMKQKCIDPGLYDWEQGCTVPSPWWGGSKRNSAGKEEEVWKFPIISENVCIY